MCKAILLLFLFALWPDFFTTWFDHSYELPCRIIFFKMSLLPNFVPMRLVGGCLDSPCMEWCDIVPPIVYRPARAYTCAPDLGDHAEQNLHICPTHKPRYDIMLLPVVVYLAVYISSALCRWLGKCVSVKAPRWWPSGGEYMLLCCVLKVPVTSPYVILLLGWVNGVCRVVTIDSMCTKCVLKTPQ